MRFHGGRKYVLAVRLCARCEMGQVVFETQLQAWVSRDCTLVAGGLGDRTGAVR